ncbi:MAG: hypothetical protein AAB795_02635 [Patescibacteria group bacterium]
MSINKKQLATAVLLLMSNIALGFWWNLIPKYPLLAIFALSSGLLWILFVLFAEDRAFFYIISAISILLLGIGIHLDIWSIIGLVFGAILAIWAFSIARKTYHSNIKFLLTAIVGRSVRIYFTAMAVVFSLAYFGVVSNASNVSSLILPEEVFNIGMQILEKPFQAIIPGIHAKDTVDEALAFFVQSQLKQTLGLNVTVPSLSQIRQALPAERKEIIRTLNKEFGTNIDINTKGTEKLSTVLYRISLNKIDEYAKRFSSYVPWILAVGFFFSLKAISFVYYYASIIFSVLFVKILLSIGALKIETAPATKEILI